MDENEYLKIKKEIKDHRMQSLSLIIGGGLTLTFGCFVCFLSALLGSFTLFDILFFALFLGVSGILIRAGLKKKSKAGDLEIKLEAYDRERRMDPAP